MNASLALQLIQALVSDFPELLKGVKDIIAAIEGNAPAAATQPPLDVAGATQAADDALHALANSNS